MIRTRFFAFTAGLLVAASAAFAAFADSMREVGQSLMAFVHVAFPLTPTFELAVAVAAAPRVTGLHETRAFHQRLIDTSGDGCRRAPLSSAFAAAA